MADYYFVGEIRMFAGDFAPKDWALCRGQTLNISQNPNLFSLIGTTYGGDGQTTFCLPDLQGRVPVHIGTCQDGTTYELGQSGGAEQVTLTIGDLPPHSHNLWSTSYGQTAAPAPNTIPALATSSQQGIAVYGPPASPLTSLAPESISMSPQLAGESHDNVQPYVALSFIIALKGDLPPHN